MFAYCGKAQPEVWLPISAEQANTKFQALRKSLDKLQNYSVNVTHRTFQNYTNDQWAFEYKGFVKRQGSNFHSLLMGIHTIQNTNFKVVVDTQKQIILVSNPSELIDLANSDLQNEKYLNQCSSIKMKCEGQNCSYELVYDKMYPYSKIVFSFNSLQAPLSIKMYLNKIVKTFSNETEIKDKPRIEINYSHYNTNVIFSENEFSEKKYIKVVSGKLKLTEAYKNYLLKDLRFLTKT